MSYVHGYSRREAERLDDQATILRELIHGGLAFAPGSKILEPGCGTGAQTAALLARHPGIEITALDCSEDSLSSARDRVFRAGLSGVSFLCGDLFSRPWGKSQFDAAFVCFLLEHLEDPCAALSVVREAVRPGGTLTVIEGDHGACVFYPETPEALAVWRALPACQARLGGDGLIGRRLVPLLIEAGYTDIHLEPRWVRCDALRPEWNEGFVRKTIVPMVAAVRDQALANGMVSPRDWDKGLSDLARTAEKGGSFSYLFSRATARVPLQD